MLTALCGASSLPFEMLTFPKSRFGSFCSMQALLRSTTVTLIALGVARFFDWLKTCFPDSETYHYRFAAVWPILCYLPVVIVAVLVYREWGRLGGYKNYACPAIWSPDGREAVEQPPERLPCARILQWVLLGYDLLMVLGVASAVIFAGWHFSQENFDIATRFLAQCGGIAVVTAVFWWLVRGKITRDIRLCLAGEQPRNGIPHHGLLLLEVIIFLGGLVLGAVGAAYLEPEHCLVFLMFHLLANFAVVVTTYLICKMEKGIVMAVAP